MPQLIMQLIYLAYFNMISNLIIVQLLCYFFKNKSPYTQFTNIESINNKLFLNAIIYIKSQIDDGFKKIIWHN